MTLIEVKERILNIHLGIVELDESTYVNTRTKCRFIDKEYGEWWATPNHVLNKKTSHPSRRNDKRKQTWLKIYGVDHPTKTKEIQKKQRETCLRKYNVEYPCQSEEIIKKKNKTCLELYGVENPFQNNLCKEKSKQTCLTIYGVENAAQSEEILEKRKQTWLKIYGVENVAQSKIIQDKRKQTCLKKYGVEHQSQNTEIALKQSIGQHNSYILYHWGTCEELSCTASYEVRVVKYLNDNKINYEWQSKIFDVMVDKKRTYRPDLYLVDNDLWVEIKGYKRELSMKKYFYFHTFIHPNSELWDKEKLKSMGILP